MKRLFINIFLTILFSIFISLPAVFADEPPPPGGGPGSGDPPVGGGTPVGEGLVLLITLGAGYAGKKVFQIRKNKLQ